MSDNTKVKIALIPTGSNQVSNIIIADSGYTQDGYAAQVVASGVFCEPGMYYNEADSLYYQDEAFTVMYPYTTDYSLPGT